MLKGISRREFPKENCRLVQGSEQTAQVPPGVAFLKQQ